MTSALREQLREKCDEAAGLHSQLGRIIHLRDGGKGGGRTGKLDHSQPPWAAPAALTLLELHAWVRAREAEWRLAANFAVRRRGGSDENTLKALEALCALAHSVDDGRVASSLRELARWNRNARVVLGEMELPKRLPRAKGAPEPSCPYCERKSLRMLALQGIVRCVNVECRDGNERRPVARMEWSGFTQQLELIWADGVTGLITGQE